MSITTDLLLEQVRRLQQRATVTGSPVSTSWSSACWGAVQAVAMSLAGVFG